MNYISYDFKMETLNIDIVCYADKAFNTPSSILRADCYTFCLGELGELVNYSRWVLVH